MRETGASAPAAPAHAAPTAPGRASGLLVLGAALLVLAYFPWGLLIPNFVALVPVLAWLDRQQDAPLMRRLWGTFLFGLGTHLVVLHWIYAMMKISWIAVFMYIGLALWFASGIMVSLSLAGWIHRRTGLSYAWILPPCWLPVEWHRSLGDLRMTADHLGHTLGGYPFLVQFADVLGPYGVGAFMLVVNALIYQAWVGRRDGRWLRPAVALAVVFAVVLSYDAVCWWRPVGGARSVRAAFVQPNIPLEVKHATQTSAMQSQILRRLSLEAARRGAELIVWPETARPTPLIEDVSRASSLRMPEVEQLARETGAAMLVGVEYARVREPGRYELYNAAFLVRPDGTLDPTWTAKVYLVPFTEKIPFDALLGRWLEGGEGEMRWLSGGFRPGPRGQLLQWRDLKIGVLVCFEELFPDLARDLRRRGANLMAVITNDAWFGRTVFQPYLANAVRLRAIENRVSYIRSANTGISGFVDPRGRFHAWTGLFREGVAVADLPVVPRPPLYTRLGDLVLWLSFAGLVLLIVQARRRGGRRRPGGESRR